MLDITPEVQSIIDRYFPTEYQDAAAIDFLRSHGFVLHEGSWNWSPPVPHHTLSFAEMVCIRYLEEEWDFGPLTNWKGRSGFRPSGETRDVYPYCDCPQCYAAHQEAEKKLSTSKIGY